MDRMSGTPTRDEVNAKAGFTPWKIVKSDRAALHAGLALERRRSPRRRSLKRATIVFHRGYCTMGCHILDISETGALLKPADIFLCPSEFVLKPDIGAPHDCEVVWRKGEMVGVHFV